MCAGKNHTTTKQIKGQERQRRKQQQRQKKRGKPVARNISQWSVPWNARKWRHAELNTLFNHYAVEQFLNDCRK